MKTPLVLKEAVFQFSVFFFYFSFFFFFFLTPCILRTGFSSLHVPFGDVPTPSLVPRVGYLAKVPPKPETVVWKNQT